MPKRIQTTDIRDYADLVARLAELTEQRRDLDRQEDEAKAKLKAALDLPPEAAVALEAEEWDETLEVAGTDEAGEVLVTATYYPAGRLLDRAALTRRVGADVVAQCMTGTRAAYWKLSVRL